MSQTTVEQMHDETVDQPEPKRQSRGGGCSVRKINVSDTERKVSMGIGALLGFYGVSRKSIRGLVLAAIGAGLVKRGVTGHCPIYSITGTNRGSEASPEDYYQHGIHVEHSVTIEAEPRELYGFWKNLENLPTFMHHLISVKQKDEKTSHWVARAPAGLNVQWDAEIINDEPDQRIAWRSVGGADVSSTGSVRFIKAPGNRGTEVHVTLDYLPPAGRLGKWVAYAFGEAPEFTIREDLRRLKMRIEAGELATVEGQPKGNCRCD